ncbi:carbamoyltransferase [Aliiglaciecola sp. M165]|uniref:carbamoyltransferase family protein n=1 Tax=Aliiglaciecola sp. M165 TaxID=2593649 RepID=UPI00117F27C0|nr:carbamoyltransferase [Aliiglaciecola sp. M165]TRY32457.1 carbamoyltransferase [Aliiglaciecola sp. M165]
MTIILGISAYYHDSAATIVVDGEIVAAAQEERFSRVKHDPAFPAQAILFCLERANCTLEQIDAVIFYDKPMLKFERLLETYLAHAPSGFLSFLRAMPIWLKEKLYLKSVLRQELRTLIHQGRADKNQTTIAEEKKYEKRPNLPQLLFSEHHQSHAASAFFPSPFEKAVVLCLDGVGEWATSSAWLGEKNQLTPLWEIQFPHSLGLLYSAFTYYCGFRVNSGEYKLMGLAPYGEPKYVDTIFNHLITVNEDGSFALDMSYFDYPAGDRMTNKKFDALFGGPAKQPDDQITQREMDLARSIQVVTEEIVLKIAKYAHQQTGMEYLCLAGGVALNCVANGRVLREGPFKDIWIQPAAGDAGGSLGAALLAWHEYYEKPRDVSTQSSDSMQGAYLGTEYTNAEIEGLLKQKGAPYSYLNDDELFAKTAKYIDEGKVIGWFQGKMEFGPRALGNRSIIGDPRNQTMQSQMNLKIKQRESFRPFAPAVLIEDSKTYFDLEHASPYMLLVAEVKSEHRINNNNSALRFGIERLNEARSVVPAITHVDYSARVQSVDQKTNPRFHRLLSEFKQMTGTGMLINTSFNVRGEPPVCSPEDALRCFLATEMDMLVLENCMLFKAEQDQKLIVKAKQVVFEKD